MKNSKGKIRKALGFYDQIISQPHKAEIKRELRDENDLFLLMCFSELLGIPNPVSFYTLELYPYILDQFHEWHLRMGMEKSPLDHIRCC